MNRKEFENLKKKTETTIEKHNAKAAQLQTTIEECVKLISAQSAAMNDAEENNNPEAYQAAFALLNMYRDRKRKAEEEHAASFRSPVIPSGDWADLVNFLQTESAEVVKAEQAAIWDHLKAIYKIVDETNAYYHELSVFAQECERANNASITGTYKTITISHLPEHWLDELRRAGYFFRPKE